MGTPTIDGDITGSVLEDSGVILSGDLDDVGLLTDDTDDIWSIASGATYGAASIDPSTGTWTYDLDDSNLVVDALGAGQILTDTFTVLMEDTAGFGAGTSDTQVVTITITGVPCLTRGTLIETVQGGQPIEAIRIGDVVAAKDGFKEVAWVGHRVLEKQALQLNPKLRPVCILAGALGNGLPKRDLCVSRQHRMLLQSKIAERMFGKTEVLVPAIKLVGLPGIYIDEAIDRVEYYHLLFDQHEVIYAEGAPTEGLFTGPEALKTITPEAREEILTLFPEVGNLDYTPEPARYIPPGNLQKQLVARHAKNGMPLLC